MIVEKGTILLISAGEYSDYSILDTFRVTAKFDTVEVISEYQEQFTDDQWGESHFQQWLKEQDLVEELEIKEWYIHSRYHGFELRDKITKAGDDPREW